MTSSAMLGETLFAGLDDEEDEHDRMEGEDSRDADASRDSAEAHPDDVEGDYTCKHCGIKFTSQFLFAKHIRDHLFPVYNYSEGPPRRGRRPVPLKIGDYKSYSSGLRGRPRGRGRGRGRPRGGHVRMLRTGTGRGPGRPRRIFLDSEMEDESSFKKARTDEEIEKEEVNNEVEETAADVSQSDSGMIGITTNDTSGTLLYKDEESEGANVVEKKKRGRPRKIKTEFSVDSSAADMLQKSPEKSDVSDTPQVDGSSLRPRRSSRAFRGLGKLGKWLKYPGEASSDEETPQADSEEDEERIKPVRKRFGVAMAASLRKAAMDEITSPIPKRRVITNPMGSKSQNMNSLDSPVKKVGSTENIKTNLNFERPVVLEETMKGDNMISIMSTEKSQPVEESPKKYIVVTKGDTSTAYEISSSVQDKSLVPTSLAPVVVKSEKEDCKNCEQNQISDNGKLLDGGSIELAVEICEVDAISKVDSVNNKESEVEVGTREEVVGVAQHDRKNTIADLDGTDALTALVNAAISADKVPDPIAMVAADLYEDRSLEDDGDSDEYKAAYRKSSIRGSGSLQAETGDDGEDSENERLSQPLRQRRKKRRRGDDPELEELEKRTKSVEGPNGTEEFACGICNKHFTQLKYLKLHLPAHTDRYRCNICGKRFARNESLLKHTCDDTATLVEQTVDDEGNDSFCCRECGRSFNQLNFAIRHASMHRTRFSCDKCGRTFLRQVSF